MTLAAELPGRSSSILAQINPRWRLVGLLIWTASVSAATTLSVAAVGLAGSTFLWAVSGVSICWLGKRLWALAPFLALLAIPLIVFDRTSGALAAMLLIVKSLAIAIPVIVQVGIGTSAEMWDALRWLRVPGSIVSLFMLSERCATLLADSFNRTRRAMCIRGFQWKTNRQTYQTVGAAIGATAQRGIDHSRRIGQALACRGYIGEYIAWRTSRTAAMDIVFAATCLFAGAALVAWDWWPRT